MISEFNFNSHPELNDQDFATIAGRVYTGNPTWALDPSNATENLQYIATNGRYSWVTTQLYSWGAGNSHAGWFFNIPPWAWMVILPATVIVAGVLIYKAYGADLMRKSGLSEGNGSSYL